MKEYFLKSIITESPTGKRKLYDKEGEEMKWEGWNEQDCKNECYD